MEYLKFIGVGLEFLVGMILIFFSGWFFSSYFNDYTKHEKKAIIVVSLVALTFGSTLVCLSSIFSH